MQVLLRILLIVVPIVALLVLSSLRIMEQLESQWLMNDLARRASLIADSLSDYLVTNLQVNQIETIERRLSRLSLDERLVGIEICSADGEPLVASAGVPRALQCSQVVDLSTNHGKIGTLLFLQGIKFHVSAQPILSEGKLLGYLAIVHDTSYMERRAQVSQQYVFTMMAALIVLLLILTALAYRWAKGESLRLVKKMFRGLINGEHKKIQDEIIRSDLSPLADDLSQVAFELRQAKGLVKESEVPGIWTPERLRAEVQKLFGNQSLTIVANREPYVHNFKDDKIEVLLPASGLVTAVEPIVRACRGLWIGHGSGTADLVTADPQSRLAVPPDAPEYTLRRVWLSKEQEDGYYYGFSNEGLWPLCHIAHTRPNFESEDYKHYHDVNRIFADAFAQENPEQNPVALIQDYHFALLPGMIRERRPDAMISLFWHIPWPNPEAFWHMPLEEGTAHRNAWI